MTNLVKKSGYDSVSVLCRLKTTGADKNRGILYLRVTVNGHRGPERSTGIRITKADWNAKSQTITTADRESQLHNARLAELKTAILDAQRELEQRGETITAQKLLERGFGQRNTSATIGDIFRDYIAETKATRLISPKTLQTFHKYFNNVSEYFTENGHKNPLLEDITKDKFQGLIVWLRDRYKQDYAVKNAQFLRRLVAYAQANGKLDRNPLTTIRLEKANEYDTTHLTQDQVQQLAAFDFTALTLPAESIRVLNEERDAFVWTSYTGQHHVDYINADFTISKQNGRIWLSGHRVKSRGGRKDKPYSIPLHPLAIAILDKYGSVKNLPKRNNAKRNRVLKEIAAYVGLNVHLTTKTARKTLAGYCLNDLNAGIEVVAAILGHTSLKYVQYYAAITKQSIDRAIQFEPSKGRKR